MRHKARVKAATVMSGSTRIGVSRAAGAEDRFRKNVAERQRRRAHHGRDEQCLGQQLTHDPPAVRTNRQPCRELPPAGECPRELQVSDVRTGEQQDCEQATEYQRERRDAHGAAWLIERPGAGERDDARFALRCRIELRHQDGQLSSRRLA